MAWWDKRYQGLTQQTTSPSQPSGGSGAWWEKRYQGIVQNNLSTPKPTNTPGFNTNIGNVTFGNPEPVKPLFDFSGFLNTTKEKVNTTLQNIQDPKRRAEADKRGADLVANIQKGLVEFGKDVLRAGPRAGVSTVLSLRNQPRFEPGTGVAPKTEKFLLGEKPVRDIKGTGEQTIMDFGGNKEIATKYGLPLGAVLTTLDLIPGIPKKKIAEEIARQGSEKAILNILKQKVFKDIPDDVGAALALRLKPLKNVNEVEAELDLFTKNGFNVAEDVKTVPLLSGTIPQKILQEQPQLLRKPTTEQFPLEGTSSTVSKNQAQGLNRIQAQVDHKTSPDIIPQSGRGDLKPPVLNLEKVKDVTKFRLTRDTITRNVSKVFGKEAPKVEKFLVEPLTKNETNRVKFVNELKTNISKTVVKDLGIKKGSLEDKLVQRYGEKNISLEELKKATPKWEQVAKASEFFRQTYDDLLKQVNEARQQFDYNPIPKREDYFRHFQELSNVVSQFGLIFREQDLPTGISGLTGFFKPGKPFTTAELRRIGGKYTESAIGGIEDYLPSVSRQMFHIDSVQRARQLEKYIRQSGDAGIADLPNFVANLSEFGNLLAGKKADIDRAAEATFGRGLFSLLNFGKRRTSANMIAGNISSALTNFIPFTQALATTRKDKFAKGMAHAMFAPFSSNLASISGQESGYLVRKFPSKEISPTVIQGTKNKLMWVFESIDKFVSKTIVGGKYFESLSKGMTPEQAMLNADKYAAKVLADRSIGGLPNLMESKSLGIITQFQVEVNNMVSFIKRDIPEMSEGNRLKLASQLGQFFIYSYLFNNLFEKVTGRRPTIDPIHSGLTLIGQTEEGENKDLGERAASAAKDLADNLPFSNVFTGGGRFPISAGLPDVAALAKGEADPIEEFITKPLTFLASPVGGGLQAKKTIEGIQAYQQGGSTTKTGKTRFEIEKTPTNALKTAIFGQYAVPEAKEYFTNLGKSKSELIFNEFKDLKTPEEKKELWNKMVRDQRITKGNVSDVKQWFEDEKLGVTEKERKMRSLSVEDRAKTVIRELNKLETKDEKNQYVKALQKKKVVTDQVFEQLKILIKNEAQKDSNKQSFNPMDLLVTTAYASEEAGESQPKKISFMESVVEKINKLLMPKLISPEAKSGVKVDSFEQKGWIKVGENKYVWPTDKKLTEMTPAKINNTKAVVGNWESKFGETYKKTIAELGLAPDVVKLLVTSENGKEDPNYINRNSNGTFDVGLLQVNVKPANAEEIKKLKDPEYNIPKGLTIMKSRIDNLKDPMLAIASYNLGARGAVMNPYKALSRVKYLYKNADLQMPETEFTKDPQGFVKRNMEHYKKLRIVE